MNSDLLIAIATYAGVVVLALIGLALIVMKFYQKVEQGQAMIVNTMKETPEVTFTGRTVWPVIHKKEFMNISLKTIEIDRRAQDGLICKDNIRADIKVTFFVRVNKTKEDVLKVAQAIGCERASKQATIEELFSAKFSEALKTVGKKLEFEELYEERDRFRDEIIMVIGKDLNGYVLEDAAIDYLEQTPISSLDENNILDAQGIRKITELTAKQKILTNEFEREEETKIKKRDVEARERILELERIEADAEARQMREIASVKAREEAEKEKIESEERLKAETARIATDQELMVLEENKQREVEVAANNRMRAVAIEEEKVTKVRQLEIVGREREVALQEINKEKDLEVEKKNIADVVRERIAVEKTVAEQEEKINELRVVEEAKRNKQAQVIAAEALAEQDLIKEIKAAEAQETTAKHRASERITLAEAARESAAKEADAKIRLAEGVREEAAATGLAEAKVIEAKAAAHQKQGEAEAAVMAEKFKAEAVGAEDIGMANVRVKEADAQGEEQQAMVAVKIKVAEAQAIEERYAAEARGLKEKFAALATMDETVREHEEFRMGLDMSHVENMKAIEANTGIAETQAKVLAEALKEANIDIVGGNGDFLEKFMSSLAVGKAVDGAIGKSDILQAAVAKVMSLGNGKSFDKDTITQMIKKLSRNDEQDTES
ncbi:hypothetical protein OS175_06790 [Marinicella sp. S1101]|uniref:hypothetical protein n=1 Tax=Marinicella marina TaxID=2996016 RepID=UPI002260FCAC|nr:hypothetical protein [Marinicella marina]MCX7553581.1 hypothetical protein [Marinicella marina]MDJ1140205.1 hypothetical protein [Marinicella marina]